MKPLLLLDVDGPLNPYRQLTKKGYLPPKVRRDEPRFEYEKHLMRPPGWETGEQLPVLLSREMGELLLGLQDRFTLIWATSWEGAANEWIAPVLGLPELPVIGWPAATRERDWPLPGHRGSWKTKLILQWLGTHAVGPDGAQLPWVWVDDEIRSADRALVRAHYDEQRGDPQTVRRWLFEIHPTHGLRHNDFDDLRQWAIDAEQ